MIKLNINSRLQALMVLVILFMSSCTKDYINPGAATDEQVFSSPQGLTGVAVGLQRVYTSGRASSLYNRVSISALLTNEVIVVNQGNTSEFQLQLGGNNVDGTNTMLGGLWTSSNKILYDAEKVIKGAEALTDKNYASGLLGYATIFKALALGDMAMFWEKVPAGLGANVTFTERNAGYTTAISAIDKALAAITANAISASFTANVPAGIDVVNTLHALKARYSLFLGNYPQALASANAVDLTKRSTFNFNTVNLNPIFETATSTRNVYLPGDRAMGLPASLLPDAADKRLNYHITLNAVSPFFLLNGFAAASTTAWPIYLPGEMTLIKAEAYARQSSPDLNLGLAELNKVVTKATAADPYSLGAELPAITGPITAAQLLEQIYKHRSIELYLAGLKLEDMRRFQRPIAERKRSFLPYPFLERDNNTNTPPDPAF
jgi:starch-binding outer membrane protein, SusD/RagB family